MSGGGGGHGHRRGGHDEEHEEHENHERWLVSYADMMTLLMVLFIVMFAISQVDQKKFMALKTGLTAGFGAPVAMLNGADYLLDVGGAVAPDSVNLSGSAGSGQSQSDSKGNSSSATGKSGSTPTDKAQVSPEKVAELVKATEQGAVAQEVETLQRAREDLKKALAKAGMPKSATFRFDERGLVVTIAADNLLFDSGEATLLPAGRAILDALSPALRRLPNRISIDGHTNSIPIHTREFPSNWELSADRATGVLRYLVGERHLPEDQVLATGFADTRPLLPAGNPRALAANRRVEIVVLARVDNSAGRAVAALGNRK